MSNYIINGDFSSGFDYFDNGIAGGVAYTLDTEQAKATSATGATTEIYHTMRQVFSLNNEVVSAKLSVWCKWLAPGGTESDGATRFIIVLVKPNMEATTLLDTTKTADTDEGYLLDESDIASELDQHGNYSLWLNMKVKSAHTYVAITDRHTYPLSYGWYDNINADIAVKKYKAVHEILGSQGLLGGEAKVSRSGIVSLSEAYSTEVFSPSFNYETASGLVGLSESYSTIKKRLHAEVGIASLSEAIQAKRTQGNIETTFTLEDLTQWTEVSREVTPWVRTKTIIN